jgi:polysaccharide pyruvyl transferase WcaK-like protein
MSKKLLEKNNIRVDGLLPDLAFHLFDNDANAATKPAQKICFNFRTDQYEGQLDDVQSRVKEIIALMPEDTTYAIASQVARDDKGMKALADFMRDDLKLEVETNFNATDIKAMQDFYRTCDCVISNRLHSLMLGASTCDKCIALINAKNQKIAGLFETCGAKDSILYMNSEIEEKTFRKAHQALFKGQKSYQELVQGFSAIFKL